MGDIPPIYSQLQIVTLDDMSPSVYCPEDTRPGFSVVFGRSLGAKKWALVIDM